jgi:hypothetical protein
MSSKSSQESTLLICREECLQKVDLDLKRAILKMPKIEIRDMRRKRREERKKKREGESKKKKPE